jgi:hypothetical protein
VMQRIGQAVYSQAGAGTQQEGSYQGDGHQGGEYNSGEYNSGEDEGTVEGEFREV